MKQTIIDNSVLHAKEKAREAAGHLYQTRHLHMRYTVEAQDEADREKGREWIKRIKKRMEAE
jgi:hypothetical protein